MDTSKPLIIAHRTCPPYAPENSLQGIREAFEQQADGVEIDLRMSLDFQPLLMHDNSMWRTTGWPLPIEITPLSLVRRRRLKGGSEPPPSLAEAITTMPADKLLAVDVKTPWSVFPLVKALENHHLQARALIWCSSQKVVSYLIPRLPEAEVAYYKDFEDGPSNVEFVGKAARIGAQGVSLDWRAITPDLVALAHHLGLKVYSWHKEHAITAEKLETGLDGVITDHPRLTRAAIQAT